ncbi:MAG: substrate-binding domain-containing protein [Capsulimonadaceae bacterium]
MATQRAKCTNFGNCTKADHGEIIDLMPGAPTICPICGRPLTILPSTRSGSPVGAILGLIVVLLIVAAFLMMHHTPSTSTGSGGQTASAGGSGDTSTAPPVVNPGDALMYYERSDGPWLKPVTDAFNKQHTGQPQIVMDYRGSRDGKQDILYGKGQPVIWNPADTYWVDKLNQDWTNPKVGKHDHPIIDDSRTIVTTRYVFVMWKDRATVFTAAMREPQYRGKTWQLLYDVATKGWASIGGDASWGKLKFAQSDPTKSNGGQTTLVLMYYEYLQSHPGVEPSSPGFVNFMRTIEGCVVQFVDTTSKSIGVMTAQGESGCDMAVIYEQNAVAAIDKGTTDIEVVYPAPTMEIDFPAAIVNAPWVTSDESTLARSYVDFLLTRDNQAQAAQLGFRPALDDLHSAVDDAFSTGARADAGLNTDPPTIVHPVDTTRVDDLLYQWYKLFGHG